MKTIDTTLRQLSHDIHMSGFEVKILIGAIVDKIDGIDAEPTSASVLEIVDAINCFASCALRNLDQILSLNQQVSVKVSA